MIRWIFLVPRAAFAVGCVAVIVPAGMLLFWLGRGERGRYP